MTPGPSLMSVPRPAMFVAIVTDPGWPASATIWDSRLCCFAFRTLWPIPRRLSMRESVSETSTFVVPTRTGSSMALSRSISSMSALYFSRLVLKIRSSRSSRITGSLVGMTKTSRS